MHDIVILGAGELGGTLAHLLARSAAEAAIRLVDDVGQVAVGKALDIMQAAPIEGFAGRVSGHTELTAPPAGHLVVLADPARGGEWEPDQALLMLKRLRNSAGSSVTICAGAAHLQIVERGVVELGYARERLFGTAPEALAGALRAMVAIEAGRSPREVMLNVLGVPPSQVVIPWEAAAIGGFRANSILDRAARRRLAARVEPLWPPGPLTLAAAAAKAVEAVVLGSRQSVCAFVTPDHLGGRRFKASAMPVQLGPDGIAHVERPDLNAHDQVALENAISL